MIYYNIQGVLRRFDNFINYFIKTAKNSLHFIYKYQAP